MPDKSFLDWPFFDDRHRAMVEAFDVFVKAEVSRHEGARDDTDVTRQLWTALGRGGWTKHCFAAGADGRVDLRAVALMRERLAYLTGIADVSLSEPWLGGLPIALGGSPAQHERWLEPIIEGASTPAFALSEPGAGTDVRAIETVATQEGDGYSLKGTKTWTSNAGVADLYVVFAQSGDRSSPSITAFVVPGDCPGIRLVERVGVLPPHSVGTLAFDDVLVPAENMLGAPGQGFGLAMQALDLFRPTVGAATLGFARRALDEAAGRTEARSTFGKKLIEHQLVQQKIAEMALMVDVAALLVYRACWLHDTGAETVAREAAMAKLYATEAAQAVVDEAVQLFGGLGVVEGVSVERLYREVRAFRIFDGASDIQKLIIARHILGGERRPVRE